MVTPVSRPLGLKRSARVWRWRPSDCLTGVLFFSCTLSISSLPRPPWSHAQDAAEPFDFEQASRDVMKPREIWPLVKRHTVPLAFRVLSDEIITSDTDPAKQLRKVTAHFDSQAKVQVVKAWYVYTDDEAWRDLMWYHLIMREVGDHFEAVLDGKMPDAFMIEVGDIAMGYAGYVSSTPQKLSDAPVVERRSRGSRPRLWEPDSGPSGAPPRVPADR